MPRVIFVTADEERHLDVDAGGSLMSTAVANDVPGIAGDCGGSMSCGTCHVHIDPVWRERVGGCGEEEDVLLDYVEGRRSDSRLSCQIELTDDLDGLIVHAPGPV